MNAPTDETQGKMRPTQLGMTTAYHFQTCSQIPCFICNRKNSLVFSEPFGTMFSIHLRAKRQSAACMPSNDKRMAVETSSLGGKNEMLQSVNAQRGESWRRDKNVSIYANWCPDPPPGFHCLLSGEKIKGPSVLNLPRIRLCSVACGSFSFQVSRDSSEVLRGQPSRWCSLKTGSWFCLFKVSMEMPDCA